jgi:hypothetical protein
MSSDLSRGGGLRGAGALRHARMLCAAVVVIAMVIAVAPKAASAFALGLQDEGMGQPAPAPSVPNINRAMQVMAISSVRISVHWSAVAPDTAAKPSGLRASDPSDPHYQWGPVDAAVRAAVAQHKQVLLDLFSAPVWAQGPHRPTSSVILQNAWDPNVREFDAFARAAATRYSGTFADASGVRLPRVSQWEIWNEENLPWYLAAPNVVAEYRALVNGAYDAITAVHTDNLIVMGGLAPASFLPRSVSPLRFAAELLCLRRAGTAFHRIPGCQRARFDVFAHHPYSLAATPTKHAYRYDDVLVGDMAKIATLVQSADRLRTILPAIRHRIWVTEFGWYTNPPNRSVGDSDATAARYVAYSMYEMWRASVDLVTWYTLEDYQLKRTNGANVPSGAGLETDTGAPKRMMSAFGFPVIASVARGRGYAWGRAPVAGRVAVVVQRSVQGRWTRVAGVRTGSDGVFQARFAATGNGTYRAIVIGGPTSLPYNSVSIPPLRTHLFRMS